VTLEQFNKKRILAELREPLNNVSEGHIIKYYRTDMVNKTQTDIVSIY